MAPRRFGPLQQLLASLVVPALLVVASFAVPMYRNLVAKGKESTLQNRLFNMREVIGEYTVDHKTPPKNLDELVTRGYLRAIPVDPFTGNSQWRLAIQDECCPITLDGTCRSALTVHSTSQKRSLKGDAYSRW
jgi:general secretion pathway protein G